MEILQLSMVVAVFVLAGGVKGVTGMGLPTVAMSLLGLWMAPVHAAALLIIPSLVTNVAQCRGPHGRALAKRLWPGWLAIVVVTVCAPGVGGASAAQWAKGGLGGILIAYGLWGLWRPHLPDLSLTSPWFSVPVGAATGWVTALTGVFMLPWVPYLQTLGLGKEAMVQALGISFTLATLGLAVRVQSAFPVDAWSTSMAIAVGGALLGACGGLKWGERLRAHLAGPAFQKALFVVFLALGAANLLQAG